MNICPQFSCYMHTGTWNRELRRCSHKWLWLSSLERKGQVSLLPSRLVCWCSWSHLLSSSEAVLQAHLLSSARVYLSICGTSQTSRRILSWSTSNVKRYPFVTCSYNTWHPGRISMRCTMHNKHPEGSLSDAFVPHMTFWKDPHMVHNAPWWCACTSHNTLEWSSSCA
jgi:hypothetical protein